MRSILGIIFCLLTLVASAELPESSIARYKLRSLLGESQDVLMQQAGRVIEQGSGLPRVKFNIERNNDHIYLIFVPEQNRTFALTSPGSYVVRRSLKYNAINQIKIFLSADGQYVLRLHPSTRGTTMNIFRGEDVIYKNLQLPIPFTSILLDSFTVILKTTAHLVRWDELLPNTNLKDSQVMEQYNRVHEIANSINAYLPNLPDAEDGAMDANGNLVFIETLRMQNNLPGFNCSGFAKWVADGFYYPQQGEYLGINTLKERHQNIRGSEWGKFYEFSRDPYFGLDWTRNIAAVLHALDGVLPTDIEAFDVRDSSVSHYIEDVGYPVKVLESVLYEQVVKKPGEIYFASINRPFGKDDELLLRQHTHIVVLFPYIDKNGNFQVRVFERNVETSTKSLRQRYPNDYIHLVGVPTDAEFKLAKFMRG